jgi:hypothetical protein
MFVSLPDNSPGNKGNLNYHGKLGSQGSYFRAHAVTIVPFSLELECVNTVL